MPQLNVEIEEVQKKVHISTESYNYMDKIKVSVIVPVYNTEKYLEQCMDSIVNQTLREIEIICVNDGSTDGSAEILERYQAQDPRVHVLTQSNAGVGVARNKGIDYAVGEYLMFWDSDDFFELNALELLYMQATTDLADISVCGNKVFLEINGKEIQYEALVNRNMIPNKLPFSIWTNPDYIMNFSGNVVWNKLFRSAFLKSTQLRFPYDGFRRHEDVFFTNVALCLAERITVVNQALVSYRRFAPNSITSTLYENDFELADKFMLTAMELKRRGRFPKRSFENRVLESMLWYLRSVRFSWPVFEETFNQLKNGELEKLGVLLREPGYYYNPWYEKLLSYLYNESAEGFLMNYLFIAHEMIWERTAAKQQSGKKLKNKIKNQEKLTKTQKAEIEELKQNENSLNVKIEEMKQNGNSLKLNIEELKQEINLLKTETKVQQNEINTREAKIRQLQTQIRKLQDSLKQTKNSRSYKIGRAITWLPRMIRKAAAGR